MDMGAGSNFLVSGVRLRLCDTGDRQRGACTTYRNCMSAWVGVLAPDGFTVHSLTWSRYGRTCHLSSASAASGYLPVPPVAAVAVLCGSNEW